MAGGRSRKKKWSKGKVKEKLRHRLADARATQRLVLVRMQPSTHVHNPWGTQSGCIFVLLDFVQASCQFGASGTRDRPQNSTRFPV